MQIKLIFTRNVLHFKPHFERESSWNSEMACCMECIKLIFWVIHVANNLQGEVLFGANEMHGTEAYDGFRSMKHLGVLQFLSIMEG